MYSKSILRNPTIVLMLVLGVLRVMSAIPLVQATPPPPSTITPSPLAESVDQTCPASTLELVWQTGGAPDELIIGASWLMVDMEGNIYTVANAGKHAIKKFDAEGKFVAGYGTFGRREDQFTSPTGMAVDASGNIFISDFRPARVLKFDHDWNFVTAWVTEPPTGPVGIGVDKNGDVYVANHRTHDHYVQKFDSNGQLLTEWGSNGTDPGQFSAAGHSGPEMLAVGADGSVFVTDPDNNRVQKFDSDGQFLAMIGGDGTHGQGQFETPYSVALDGEGNIYVSDFHFIQKFDSDGQFLTQWSNTGGDLIQAGFMTVDAQGNIYVIAAADVVATLTGKTLHTSVLKKFRQC